MLIHKQGLDLIEKQTLIMPVTAKILTVQMQNGQAQIWYSFDEKEHRTTERIFLIVGTGNASDLHSTDKYISTFQLDAGKFVFHVFETLSQPIKP